MKILDDLDLRLVQLLGEDARQSSEALARQLNLSSGSVRRRLRRLLKSGVLRLGALVDPDKVGLPFATFIGLDVDHRKMNSVMQRLTRLPAVRWTAMITGRVNIVAFVRLSSSAELVDFIDKELAGIDGVKNIETFVCIRTAKVDYMQV